MTPREKEIALEAAGRQSNPAAYALKMLEAEAILRGVHPPFVVWPKKLSQFTGAQIDSPSNEEKAAWLEAQAAVERERAVSLEQFRRRGLGEEIAVESAARTTEGRPHWWLTQDCLEINSPTGRDDGGPASPVVRTDDAGHAVGFGIPISPDAR